MNNTTQHNTTYYKGIEGVKEVYKDTLTISKDSYLLSTLQPSTVEPELYKWLTTEYIEERIKKGIFANVFVATDNKNDKAILDYVEKSDKELRKTHLVDADGYPFEMEIIIYENKVAFIQYNPKFEIGAYIVDNEPIANTLRSIFLHYLWKL